MIKRPANHRLHVTYQLYSFVLKSYMSQPHPHHPCYELFFFTPSHHRYNLIFLVLTWPLISTSSLWSKSSTHRIWAEQAVCFDPRLTRKNYLQTSAFPNLVVVEREKYPHALQRKATGGGATSKVVRRWLAGRGQAWPLGRQHQLLPGPPGGRVTSQQMSCGNNARVEGLDVTLDDLAGLRGRVLMNGWMWVLDSSEGEFRLGPLVLQKV